MPKRIQRKRTKGWRMPPGTVYVGRPTDYGNPYRVDDSLVPTSFGGHVYEATQFDGAILVTPENCLTFYEAWLRQQVTSYPLWLDGLRGKDLACWCPADVPCHADVLLRLANETQ